MENTNINTIINMNIKIAVTATLAANTNNTTPTPITAATATATTTTTTPRTSTSVTTATATATANTAATTDATTTTKPLPKPISSLMISLTKLLHPTLSLSILAPRRDPTLRHELSTYLLSFPPTRLASLKRVQKWYSTPDDQPDSEVIEIRHKNKLRVIPLECFQDWIESVRVGEMDESDIYREGMEEVEWWVVEERPREKRWMRANGRDQE